MFVDVIYSYINGTNFRIIGNTFIVYMVWSVTYYRRLVACWGENKLSLSFSDMIKLDDLDEKEK